MYEGVEEDDEEEDDEDIKRRLQKLIFRSRR